MALPITLPADYKGVQRISTAKGSQLTEYITDYENKYIKLLTNNDVFADLRDLPDPLPQKYLDLINGVDYTDSNGDLVIFDGLKPMLLKFVYAQYNKDNFQTSVGGNVRSLNENSEVLTADNTAIIVDRYNQAVRLYRNELCQFLEENEELSQLITGTFGIGNGTVTIELDSTKYINVGSIVTIEGFEYTVLSVVENVSFDVDETINPIAPVVGTEEVTYKPFYEFCPKYISFASWL
jgi:hypothetical protein